MKNDPTLYMYIQPFVILLASWGFPIIYYPQTNNLSTIEGYHHWVWLISDTDRFPSLARHSSVKFLSQLPVAKFNRKDARFAAARAISSAKIAQPVCNYVNNVWYSESL
ncbi:hypothetical protein ElyMa_002998000 [Elysia marginata]|uniref:Uncharacterized protein n=1 Tax=Elysia marginata TaxID=1093978 RepID=A0AAV4ICM1_9GAST|nr:hypothetical protein ElyMa_002998000 [Elysia marginata]